MKRLRLSKDMVKSYLTVCKLQELEKDYPYPKKKLDIEQVKLIYMVLISARDCLNALLRDVGVAIEQYGEKEGNVSESLIELIREQN